MTACIDNNELLQLYVYHVLYCRDFYVIVVIQLPQISMSTKTLFIVVGEKRRFWIKNGYSINNQNKT